MTRLKTVFASLALLLLAAPATQAAGLGGIDLTHRLERRLDRSVQKAKRAKTPAQQRLILSEAFRSMNAALERSKKIPMLSDEDAAAINDLQADIMEQHDRLNGLNGYAPVRDADLDHFTDDVQQNLLGNRSITLGIGTALLIVIIIILIV